MVHHDILDSESQLQVFLCVVRGKNYSALVAREIHHSQPAAVQFLKKLEKVGLIKSERKGSIIQYNISWNKIEELWIDYLQEKPESALKKNDEHQLNWVEYARLIGIEHADEFEYDDLLSKIVEVLPTKIRFYRRFPDLVRTYFTILGERNFEGSIKDAFVLFEHDVLPYILSNKSCFTSGFDKTGKPIFRKEWKFILWFDFSLVTFMGNRVFVALNAKIAQENK